FAGAALLMHQFTAVAEAAKLVSGPTRGAELGRVGIQLVAASGFAMLVLLTATTLAVYKPWGLTRYGQRMLQARRRATQQADPTGDSPGLPLGLKIFLAVIVALASVFVVLHLAGRGLGAHGVL